MNKTRSQKSMTEQIEQIERCKCRQERSVVAIVTSEKILFAQDNLEGMQSFANYFSQVSLTREFVKSVVHLPKLPCMTFL